MIKQIFFALQILTTTILYSQNLTKEEVKSSATKMLISKDYSIDVIKISEIKNDIRIALVELPYREFPSLLIFKFYNDKKEWKRVFEGLCPGIQDNPSGLLDWHTVGTGIDFITGNDSVFDFRTEKVKKMIDAMSKNKGILIPYQNFLHMHTAVSATDKDFEPYTIDKSSYFDFANQLFDNRYVGYSNDECMMFDSPKTIDFEFDYVDNNYVITAKTGNNQTWTYSFKSVDEANKYLINKKVIVKNGS